ncbi:MAG: hypothetical protein M1480_06230 [Bacteroidetes bacterium]|nr:hypothetical protein [Bacteroidota bacterium]
MAEIKSGILSDIRGAVGKVTGRIYKGRNILSQRPGFRKPSTNPAAVARKNNFRLCVKFGSAASTLDVIKAAWLSIVPADLNYFNFFIKTNLKFVDAEKLTNYNIITPYSGFRISKASSAITPASLSIEISALTGTYNFDTESEVKVKLFAVIYLSDATNPLAPEYSFMPVEFDAQALQLDNSLPFTKNLLLSDQAEIESYSSRIVYAAIATLDANDNPVNFSKTIYIE